MKTIPMIFNTEMVKALLDGRKTVTRRPMKKQPEASGRGYDWWPSSKHQTMIRVSNIDDVDCDYKKEFLKDVIGEACPFGNIGDLIWVRESMVINRYLDMFYVAEQMFVDNEPEDYIYRDPCYVGGIPSIHMPRWASRLTLRVTDVRIEQVQDITEEQAKREGVIKGGCGGFVNSFSVLWHDIYGNWMKNPYVWVIEFEVIHKNVDDIKKQYS